MFYCDQLSGWVFCPLVFSECSLSCGTPTMSLCPGRSCFKRSKVLMPCCVCWQRRSMQNCWMLQVWRQLLSQLNLLNATNGLSNLCSCCTCVYVCRTSTGPNLKVLSTMSVGFDHLSLEELKKRWPPKKSKITRGALSPPITALSLNDEEEIQKYKNGGKWS